jgi:cullin-4
VLQAVVAETHDFYRVEADSSMRSMDVPAYLLHVQRRLDEENERIIHYLDASTRKVSVCLATHCPCS